MDKTCTMTARVCNRYIYKPNEDIVFEAALHKPPNPHSTIFLLNQQCLLIMAHSSHSQMLRQLTTTFLRNPAWIKNK
eukprot:c9126_g1_i1 orf=50-280(-)